MQLTSKFNPLIEFINKNNALSGCCANFTPIDSEQVDRVFLHSDYFKLNKNAFQ